MVISWAKVYSYCCLYGDSILIERIQDVIIPFVPHLYQHSIVEFIKNLRREFYSGHPNCRHGQCPTIYAIPPSAADHFQIPGYDHSDLGC